MGLIDRIESSHRAHVQERLRRNLMAWLTSVRPDGQPECVPVWFLWRDDESILVYSQPTARKLVNLQTNPKVAMALDVSDLGRDNVRVNGVASVSETEPRAIQNKPYLAKYIERIGALFGSPERFSEIFSTPVVVTPLVILSPPSAAGVVYGN
jgi:PPOX class probable F420-dependent enzyme